VVSFPPDFPTKPLYTPLLSTTRATFPAHLILLDFITRTIFDEQHRSLRLRYPLLFNILAAHSGLAEDEVFWNVKASRPVNIHLGFEGSDAFSSMVK
jgi:hypothetical protein